MKSQTVLQILPKEKFKKEIAFLRRLFLPRPFSSAAYSFLPTKNDWRLIRKYVPSICLFITNQCNTMCKVCFTNSSPYDFSKDLSFDEIKKILKKIGRGKRITLIGGEPTVREDLFKIIELIRKTGNQPELYTNGLKLSDLDYVIKLKKCGISRVYFTFDGLDENVYEKLNGNGREVLMMKLLALKNLNKVGINTILAARVLKGLNEDQIKGLIDLCVYSAKKKGFIKGIYFYAAVPYGRFLLKNCEMSCSELISLIENITKGEVRLQYLVETKKLLLNLFKLSLKVKKPLPILGGGGILGAYRAGSIKELIPLKSLKKINTFFEKGRIVKSLFEMFKISELRNIALRFLVKKDVFKAFVGRGMFILGIGTVNTPISDMQVFIDTVGIGKNGPDIVFNLGAYSSKEIT